MDDLLKEAIADAKAVRETALASAIASFNKSSIIISPNRI